MVATSDSPLSFLQQRLRYVDQHPHRDWTVVVDNVPHWQTGTHPDIAHTYAQTDPFRYAQCEGIPELISAVTRSAQRDHQTTISAENVLVTNGAMHAIALIGAHCRHRGTHAFVQRPVLAAIPRMLADQGYSVSYFDATEHGVAAAGLGGTVPLNTGLIYLNSPNNPTGHVVSAKVMELLADTAAACGAALVCDQVYDSFGPPGRLVPTAMTAASSNPAVFYLNSMSKNYGAPGLRIGWIVATPCNIDALAGRLERENVAVTGLSQVAAAAMLDAGNEALRRAVSRSRRHLFQQVCHSALLSCHRDADTMGGSAVIVHVPVPDIESFANDLLVDFDLAVTTPSNFEGLEPGSQSWIRMPLGYPEDVIERALERIQLAAAEYDLSDLLEGSH